MKDKNNKPLTDFKIKKIIACFTQDLQASKTANILQINRNNINKYFNIFRTCILLEDDKDREKLKGEFKIDKSYFGSRRVKGKRGRGSSGKTPVFGLLKRGGNVDIQIVANCSKEQVMPIIKGKIIEGSKYIQMVGKLMIA